MRMLIKPRGTGKTTQMIHTSEATGFPIIVLNQQRKKYITEMAAQMKCVIPEPMTVEERRFAYRYHVSGLLVDDAEDIITDALNAYLEGNVVAITFSDRLDEKRKMYG